MEEPNSDDWLPAGWTVEVRVRKNGKRDKYYFSPSNGLKFKSKVEVFRYLDNAQNKVSIQKISPNVIVEKAIAEGLPLGWVKKTRIPTKEDTVRRDTYYIDPVSGYAFRSIKDVDCYLESGEVGRNTFKPKDKDSSDMELKADKSPSASVTMKATLSVSMGQSSDLDMIANDQKISRAASSGEYMLLPISECISNQCVVGTELTSSVLSRAENSYQKEEKVGLAQSALASRCTNNDIREKLLQEDSETKHRTEKAQAQDRQCKNKHKKEINLPRRASKRLAGIKVDPVPELKTRNRARRIAVKQSDEEETITNMDKSSNSLPDADCQAKQFNVLEDGSEMKCKSEKHTEKTIEVQRSDKHKECFSFSPLENNAIAEECVRVLENGDEVDAKLDYTLDFPLSELLTDPCIAFAIQTLTGVTFETSKNSETCSELKNCQHSETSGSAATAGEGHSNKSNDGSGDNVFTSSENLAIPQENVGGAKTDDKAKNETAGPSSEKTLDMSWMDPCIEFAIKTLTGTIPLDSDQNPKNCLQQQLSSSNNQHSEMALSSVSLDNIYQTDYYCSQYFGTQKPMFKQSFVDPSLQHTRNIGIGNSAGARLSHCGEDTRRNVC
ncbi:Methyl-CpG-binding domain-containing protein 13 [Spatholobus suberectus]|nr:Methyl-CpG-binding domain-containing protein 13 [Spatholobus suberectus]